MKYLILILLLLCNFLLAQSLSEKARVFVLTDIENEPDDTQSLVRFLLYSNHYDIEGLVATTSIWMQRKGKQIADWKIREVIAAYEKVRNNLLLHESGFPSSDYLLQQVKKGSHEFGMQGVGKGKDSPGSEWLIKKADQDDARPLWIAVWGGPNVLAQALWKIKETRSREELNKFIAKLRVYTISDQDDSGPWIRKEFPDLFYIVSPGSNYLHATWSGISGERWYKFASGADTSIIRNRWLRENIIEKHGPLGAKYPPIAYAMEGDTPSFLSLIQNGLNVPERPDFGGWGGRYELYLPRHLSYRFDDSEQAEIRPIWTDVTDAVVGNDGCVYIDNHATIWRWREAFQNDFAARMDWCIQPYAKANHPPVAKLIGSDTMEMKVGEEIRLDASPSSDHDGDSLSYKWIHYPEAGEFWQWKGSKLKGSNQVNASFKINDIVKITKPRTTHIILQVTDNGYPNLTRYQRVIVHILPN